MSDSWAILGVVPCSGVELEKAYKRAMRKAHPDTGGSHESFIAVQKAYKEIKSSQEAGVVEVVGLYHDGSLFNIKEKVV